ncbi:MAG: conjugal transfer protein TraG N-terminal domain-containing protein, partial [Sulfurospirillum sp.]
MFIRIAALLTLLLVSANAYTLDTTSTTVYKKDFGIFVYGDIESIENAFVLVQAISTSSQLQTIIQLFMLFFLPYTAFKMVKTGTFKPLFANLTYVTASILTMSTATVPSCSIHIEDLRLETRIASLGLPSTTYAKVDNIPYPIALVTSTVSTITDSLTILYEDAIALLKPDLEGASSKAVGSGNAINDIMKILQTTAFNKLNDAESNLFVRSLSAYVSECGLKLATSKDPDLVINFTNPNKDLFKAIDPATLNITGSTYTLTFTDGVNGEKTYQCDEFWNNNIISKYDVIASKLQERVAKVLTGDITSSNVVTSYLTMAGSINDTVIAGNIGQMKATFMNLAAMSPISKAFANTSIDMSSGQDLANRITAGTSLAELEMNGAGQMRWVSEVLPYAYNYMLGIIYSISILIMIVATAMGYEKGFGVWKNFVKGLTTYELTKVSLVIVNSSVNQYTAKHAADFIASVGQNPVTISSIPYYYHYMATMAGIAGILGAIAVLSIPAMVFSGEVSTALGALGAITGRYKGNDVNTATEVTAEQKAKQEAYERELQDQAMLDRLGVSVPAGMGASEFYGLYKRGAEAMNANLGAQRLGTNAMADAGVAVKGQTIQGIAAGQALAGNTSMSEFALSGTSGGLRHSGGIKGEGNALVDFGGDAIALSAELGAYTQGAEGVMMTNARMNAGLAGSDGRLTNKALTSMGRRAGLESANLAGMADAK